MYIILHSSAVCLQLSKWITYLCFTNVGSEMYNSRVDLYQFEWTIFELGHTWKMAKINQNFEALKYQNYYHLVLKMECLYLVHCIFWRFGFCSDWLYSIFIPFLINFRLYDQNWICQILRASHLTAFLMKLLDSDWNGSHSGTIFGHTSSVTWLEIVKEPSLT